MRMQPADDQGENGFSGVVESGMQLVCDQSSDLRIRIGSPDICRSRWSRAFSETRMSGSSGRGVGKKNGLRDLRPSASHLLRPEGAPGAGPRLRGSTHLPGRGGATSPLSELREGEAGAVGLAGRLAVLHQAVCLLGRPAMPGDDHQGCRPGNPLGLEDDQGPGEACGCVQRGIA